MIIINIQLPLQWYISLDGIYDFTDIIVCLLEWDSNSGSLRLIKGLGGSNSVCY